MDDRLAAVIRRVERDFSDPRLHFPGIGFLPATEWLRLYPEAPTASTSSGGGASGGSAVPTTEYRPSDLVCVSGGHSFLVDGAAGDEAMLVAVVSTLQDDAMDQLAAPWPALQLPDGTLVGVLEPQCSPNGIAVWATGSGYACPIGELQAVFGALSLIG
jgi:hypothetical protein